MCSSWLSRSQRRHTAYLSTKFYWEIFSLYFFFRFVNACIFFFFRCASFWLRNFNNAFLHWFNSFVISVAIIFSSLRSCYVFILLVVLNAHGYWREIQMRPLFKKTTFRLMVNSSIHGFCSTINIASALAFTSHNHIRK